MAITLAIVVGVTLVVSALCSLLEATLYSTRVGVLEAAKADGHHVLAAEQMLDLKRNVTQPTSAILILNTVANTAGATVAGMLAAQVWGGTAVPLFSAVLTLGILFLSEILPKTFGAVHWRGIWPVVALPLKALVATMRPLVWLTEHFSSLVVGSRKPPATTEAEIVAMIRLGGSVGQLTRTETELLMAVLHFDELTCNDVMIPWSDVVRLDASWSRERCVDVIRGAGHSRYPVCDASGSVVGLLSAVDVLTAPAGADIDTMLRPIMKVPGSVLVPLLLRTMQAERRRVAVVLDEYGNTTGVLTVIDLVEEIVGVLGEGELTHQPELQREEVGVYLISGVVPISRVRRELGLELRDQPNARTISGWVAAHLGRLPRAGDEVRVPGGTLTVERVVNDRAQRVRVVVDDPDTPEDTDAPG